MSNPNTDPASRPNRLVQEKSPYLLQHAYNPVDWYPWSDEAFGRARDENKPIFLSVGYSTCHWCHVMAHESFENPDIARILNEGFVSIKVDREERPDVDRVYMTFVQATTGGGGWPMSVWLTPDLKPFYGGTYFPPDDRHGRAGFASVLLHIQELWRNDRGRLVSSSKNLIESIRSHVEIEAAGSGGVDRAVLDSAYERFASIYDADHGGFGQAPKFPRPVVLQFLLRYWARTKKTPALDMVLFTLDRMAEGGMHDHIGGGFHRYATDRTWHVPHFEKMLYDQAQLVVSYLEAYQITKNVFYADVARGTLDYVSREMTYPGGGFYSAEDADSPISFDESQGHAEGAFYVWTQEEILRMLDDETTGLFSHHYGIKPNGNVRQDPFGEFKNKNILFVARAIEETAKQFNRTPEETAERLREARKSLMEVRAARPRPHRDDKVLTAWNGLMISAFARGFQVLGDRKDLEFAEKAAEFVRENLWSGELKRRFRDGRSDIEAYVDDYAFLIQGLLDLYEASLEERWLNWAIQLQEKQDELFWDEKNGGYFMTTGRDPSILLRVKENYDGAEPSPNSVAVLNLLRLFHLTGIEGHYKKAEKTLRLFLGQMRIPEAMPLMLAAADFFLQPPKQIVIAGRRGSPDVSRMLRAVHEPFLPTKAILFADGGETQRELARHLPFLEDVCMRDGQATAFLCENNVCQLPTNDIDLLRERLSG